MQGARAWALQTLQRYNIFYDCQEGSEKKFIGYMLLVIEVPHTCGVRNESINNRCPALRDPFALANKIEVEDYCGKISAFSAKSARDFSLEFKVFR